MNANELRIGNWIKVPIGTCFNTTEYVQVKTIGESQINSWQDMGASGGVEFEDINPIPLTHEILEKAGFSHHDNKRHRLSLDDSAIYIDLYRDLSGEVSYFHSCNYCGYEEEPIRGYDMTRKLNYLHQVQNLIFALTGEEIEIEL